MFKSQKQTNERPLPKKGSAELDHLTGFLGELREGLHPLLPVAALRGHGGHVAPAQGPDDVHHGLGLEGVGRNHPREEVVAPVVAQLRGRRRVADLWDLEDKDRGQGSVRWEGEGGTGEVLLTFLRWCWLAVQREKVVAMATRGIIM